MSIVKSKGSHLHPPPNLLIPRTCENGTKLFFHSVTTKFSASKSEEIVGLAGARRQLAGVHKLVTSPFIPPTCLSIDLLHPAISGLALPQVETANGVDLRQMIWGSCVL